MASIVSCRCIHGNSAYDNQHIENYIKYPIIIAIITVLLMQCSSMSQLFIQPLFYTEWNRELTPLLLPKASWNRKIVNNRAHNQYSRSAYLLSVDRVNIHCSKHRNGLVLFGDSVMVFFLVLLLCVVESVSLSAAATSGACATALQTMAAVQSFLFTCFVNKFNKIWNIQRARFRLIIYNKCFKKLRNILPFAII